MEGEYKVAIHEERGIVVVIEVSSTYHHLPSPKSHVCVIPRRRRVIRELAWDQGFCFGVHATVVKLITID